MADNFNRDFKEVFDACKRAIEYYAFSIDSIDEENGIIYASSPPNIFSWGENIIVKLQQISTNNTKITVESSPKAQVFDWGKSRENERKILSYLKELLR